MKKITLLFILLITLNVSSQTILFEDGFETYTDFAITDVGSWTLLDVDGLPTYGFTGVTFLNSGSAKSFQVFNATATDPALDPTATSDWTAYNGMKGMVCFAAVPSGANYNNDWLISPQITLAESGNSLSFWYKACDATYSQERFSVSISTTGTAAADFTVISANPVIIADGDNTWQQFTYDFPVTYDNTSVYVGIHCTSQDQFGFMIDDFSVSTSLLSVEDFEANQIHIACKERVLTLSNIHGSAAYSIYSLTGKKVLSGQTQLESQEINLTNLSSGMYVVEVADSKTNAVNRKKFVIQ
ncbi:T9SS-dependent choice-of-anchor J family protein [Bizionia arctica]|uniref:T9SS type A sorting domain-containing protein n=1 Tax=Bizionia arctica TaxID=1495645 RepID=A0A917G9X5_9FLAO|nr:choice-of-anchor J domain-containing protein [Bizionia arctica]GGG32740.1 hypothetical protein GCM10010976_00660 [Bizionia arctica]